MHRWSAAYSAACPRYSLERVGAGWETKPTGHRRSCSSTRYSGWCQYIHSSSQWKVLPRPLCILSREMDAIGDAEITERSHEQGFRPIFNRLPWVRRQGNGIPRYQPHCREVFVVIWLPESPRFLRGCWWRNTRSHRRKRTLRWVSAIWCHCWRAWWALLSIYTQRRRLQGPSGGRVGFPVKHCGDFNSCLTLNVFNYANSIQGHF